MTQIMRYLILYYNSGVAQYLAKMDEIALSYLNCTQFVVFPCMHGYNLAYNVYSHDLF